MIAVTDLVKRFGPTIAVDHVTFSIQPGEVVGFLGPNGAGKTTTIRVLCSFHAATSGSATIGGRDVGSDSVATRRLIGYLPENVPIYHDLRVVEYLRYRAELKGVARAGRNAAVDRVIERCGLAEVRRKLVGHVSRGYRQRVGLADALVANPPILVLDEPTSGLDPNQRRRMKALVRELANDHTVLFSSHILAEVHDVASRILIIDRGRIRADGKPEELLERSAGRTLRVTAALPEGELLACFDGLPGARAPRVVGTDAAYRTVVAEVEIGADPRDALFARLRARDATLRELALVLPTLEEFFARVTEGAPETAAASPAEVA